MTRLVTFFDRNYVVVFAEFVTGVDLGPPTVVLAKLLSNFGERVWGVAMGAVSGVAS